MGHIAELVAAQMGEHVRAEDVAGVNPCVVHGDWRANDLVERSIGTFVQILGVGSTF